MQNIMDSSVRTEEFLKEAEVEARFGASYDFRSPSTGASSTEDSLYEDEVEDRRPYRRLTNFLIVDAEGFPRDLQDLTPPKRSNQFLTAFGELIKPGLEEAAGVNSSGGGGGGGNNNNNCGGGGADRGGGRCGSGGGGSSGRSSGGDDVRSGGTISPMSYFPVPSPDLHTSSCASSDGESSAAESNFSVDPFTDLNQLHLSSCASSDADSNVAESRTDIESDCSSTRTHSLPVIAPERLPVKLKLRSWTIDRAVGGQGLWVETGEPGAPSSGAWYRLESPHCLYEARFEEIRKKTQLVIAVVNGVAAHGDVNPSELWQRLPADGRLEGSFEELRCNARFVFDHTRDWLEGECPRMLEGLQRLKQSRRSRSGGGGGDIAHPRKGSGGGRGGCSYGNLLRQEASLPSSDVASLGSEADAESLGGDTLSVASEDFKEDLDPGSATDSDVASTTTCSSVCSDSSRRVSLGNDSHSGHTSASASECEDEGNGITTERWRRRRKLLTPPEILQNAEVMEPDDRTKRLIMDMQSFIGDDNQGGVPPERMDEFMWRFIQRDMSVPARVVAVEILGRSGTAALHRLQQREGFLMLGGWLSDAWERLKTHKNTRSGPPPWTLLGGQRYVETLLDVLSCLPVTIDMLRETDASRLTKKLKRLGDKHGLESLYTAASRLYTHLRDVVERNLQRYEDEDDRRKQQGLRRQRSFEKFRPPCLKHVSVPGLDRWGSSSGSLDGSFSLDLNESQQEALHLKGAGAFPQKYWHGAWDSNSSSMDYDGGDASSSPNNWQKADSSSYYGLPGSCYSRDWGERQDRMSGGGGGGGGGGSSSSSGRVSGRTSSSAYGKKGFGTGSKSSYGYTPTKFSKSKFPRKSAWERSDFWGTYGENSSSFSSSPKSPPSQSFPESPDDPSSSPSASALKKRPSQGLYSSRSPSPTGEALGGGPDDWFPPRPACARAPTPHPRAASPPLLSIPPLSMAGDENDGMLGVSLGSAVSSLGDIGGGGGGSSDGGEDGGGEQEGLDDGGSAETASHIRSFLKNPSKSDDEYEERTDAHAASLRTQTLLMPCPRAPLRVSTGTGFSRYPYGRMPKGWLHGHWHGHQYGHRNSSSLPTISTFEESGRKVCWADMRGQKLFEVHEIEPGYSREDFSFPGHMENLEVCARRDMSKKEEKLLSADDHERIAGGEDVSVVTGRDSAGSTSGDSEGSYMSDSESSTVGDSVSASLDDSTTIRSPSRSHVSFAAHLPGGSQRRGYHRSRIRPDYRRKNRSPPPSHKGILRHSASYSKNDTGSGSDSCSSESIRSDSIKLNTYVEPSIPFQRLLAKTSGEKPIVDGDVEDDDVSTCSSSSAASEASTASGVSAIQRRIVNRKRLHILQTISMSGGGLGGGGLGGECERCGRQSRDSSNASLMEERDREDDDVAVSYHHKSGSSGGGSGSSSSGSRGSPSRKRRRLGHDDRPMGGILMAGISESDHSRDGVCHCMDRSMDHQASDALRLHRYLSPPPGTVSMHTGEEGGGVDQRWLGLNRSPERKRTRRTKLASRMMRHLHSSYSDPSDDDDPPRYSSADSSVGYDEMSSDDDIDTLSAHSEISESERSFSMKELPSSGSRDREREGRDLEGRERETMELLVAREREARERETREREVRERETRERERDREREREKERDRGRRTRRDDDEWAEESEG